jgi:hypothetical protein
MPAVEENMWLRLRITRQIRSLNVLQLTLRKERLGETKHILNMYVNDSLPAIEHIGLLREHQILRFIIS